MTIFSKSFLKLQAANQVSKENFLILCANIASVRKKDLHD